MSIQRSKLLIVGNGMATSRLLDEILTRAPSLFEVTVVGEEPHESYNRIMLSPVLAGEVEPVAIVQKNREWFQRKGILLITGVRVTSVNRHERFVNLSDGSKKNYDQLVLAVGSSPAKVPADRPHLDNIFDFRTLDDVERIASKAQGDALVVGGGLLGLEAAYGLAQKGADVTVVHRSKWLLNRQLDDSAGQLLQRVMEAKNIRFILGAEVTSFLGEQAVSGVLLSNGDKVSCQLVVIATGITPNKLLAENGGLACGRGICVDDFMRTSDVRISALGECCEHRGNTFGLVEPIWQQCITLAERLCAGHLLPFISVPVATKLKVSGVHVFSAGDYITQPHHREFILRDNTKGCYRKLLVVDGRIVGIVLFGDTRGGQALFQLIQQSSDVSGKLPSLVFNYSSVDVGNITTATTSKKLTV